jgi:hypothetical protein
MAFVSDFTKDPKQILLDLINDQNSSSLQVAMLTFGLPTAATGSSPARDTDLILTAVQGSGYTGSVTVSYNRVDMATIPGVRATVFQKGDATKISDLIPEINTAYQLALTTDDYVDGALPTFTGTPNEQHDFNVVAGADSIPYRGTMILQVKADDIPLSSVITTTTLNGLTYTQPA